MLLSSNATPLADALFRELRIRQLVVSKQYGHGKIVARERNDTAIIQFRRRRISMTIDSHDLFVADPIKKQLVKKRRQSPRVKTDGQSLGFQQYRKQQHVIIAVEFLSVSEVAKRLGIGKVILEKRIADRGVELRFIDNQWRIPLDSIPQLISK